MSHFTQIFLNAAAALSLGSSAPTQQRSLVIEFQGQMCTTMHPSWSSFFSCRSTRQKLLTLGNKLLWYDSAEKPEGVVFLLGQSIDLTTNTDNQFIPVPERRVVRETRTGFANWSGNTLHFLMLADGYSRKNKKLYSYKHEFFVILAGDGTCQIANWYQGGFNGYKSNTLFFVLRDYTCRVRRQ